MKDNSARCCVGKKEPSRPVFAYDDKFAAITKDGKVWGHVFTHEDGFSHIILLGRHETSPTELDIQDIRVVFRDIYPNRQTNTKAFCFAQPGKKFQTMWRYS
jgi:hypothetical protein